MNSGKREWLWWVLFAAAAWSMIVGYNLVSLQFGQGFLFALFPLLPGIFVFWWMDRFPPMGRRLWTRSVLWGGLPVTVVASNAHLMVSVVIAGMVEGSGFFDPGSGETFGSLAGSVLSAPVIEESLKIFIPLWFLFRGYPFKGPWPALFVGGLSALSFGLIENAVQFKGDTSIFPSRAFFPYLHIFFSLPALLSIGFAVYLPTLSRRLALLVSGWLLSVFLHGLWNWEVILGHSDFSIASWYLHMSKAAPPVVLIVMILVYWLETRQLGLSGITIPGLLRRFRFDAPETVSRAREERFSRCLDGVQPPVSVTHHQTGEAEIPPAG